MSQDENAHVMEVPELTDTGDDNKYDLVEESEKNAIGAREEASFTYRVERVGQNLVITFDQWSHIRHHTSRVYYPYLDYRRRRNDQSVVRPDQWLEALINGRWSLLSDADNR